METTAAAPEAAPAAKAKAPAKPKTAPKPKPAAKPKAEKSPANKRDRGMSEVPAETRRRELVKLLRKQGATSSARAVTTGDLAKKLGYTPYDVYCLAYHSYPLAKNGFVQTAVVEGSRDRGVYLTAKGAKVELDDLP